MGQGRHTPRSINDPVYTIPKQHLAITDPQTKPTDFVYRLLSYTIIVYYYPTRKLILVFIPMNGESRIDIAYAITSTSSVQKKNKHQADTTSAEVKLVCCLN